MIIRIFLSFFSTEMNKQQQSEPNARLEIEMIH